jgi:hypothetical protein
MLELTLNSLFILMENYMLSRNSNNIMSRSSNNIKNLIEQQAKSKF